MASLVENLNERQVQSCVYWSGFVGSPMTAQMQVRGVTATGGVKLTTCTGE